MLEVYRDVRDRKFSKTQDQDPRPRLHPKTKTQDQDLTPRLKTKNYQDSRQFLGSISQIFGLFFVILTWSQSNPAHSPIISKNLCEIQGIYPKFKEFWGIYPGGKSMKYIISEYLGRLKWYWAITKIRRDNRGILWILRDVGGFGIIEGLRRI